MAEGYKILPESTGGNIRVTSMWVNSANVLQQGVSIADPRSGYQMQVNTYGGGLVELQNYGLISSMYAAVASLYQRVASIESWTFTDGAGSVLEGAVGAMRSRWVLVENDTAPTSTVSGSGCAEWYSPGVRDPKIMKVKVASGTLPLDGAFDTGIRYAIDPPDDATALLMLPSTITPDRDADIGQVGAFDIVPTYANSGVSISLPMPHEVPLSAAITKMYFRHNMASSLSLLVLVQGVEDVS